MSEKITSREFTDLIGLSILNSASFAHLQFTKFNQHDEWLLAGDLFDKLHGTASSFYDRSSLFTYGTYFERELCFYFTVAQNFYFIILANQSIGVKVLNLKIL